MADFAKEFERVGIDKQNIENMLKNAQLCKTVIEVIKESEVSDENASQVGPFLVLVAGLTKNRALVAKYVGSRKIKRSAQLDAALKFVKAKRDAAFDAKEFEEACGVGIEITQDDIAKLLSAAIEANKAFLQENRYCVIGQLLAKVRQADASLTEKLKWADGGLVVKEFEKLLIALWGPLAANEQANKPLKAAPKPAATPAADKKAAPAQAVEQNKAAATATPAAAAEEEEDVEKPLSRRFQARELESAINPQDVMAEHLKRMGPNKVITRFPPEPNGFLHIGHAKAMNLSFGVAEEEGGYTVLRYDDTNPEVEEQLYFDAIKQMVEWMGFRFKMITHTSNYFDHMYNFAIKLIKEGKAYVDLSLKDAVKHMRRECIKSPYRDASVEENLRLFEDMRRGKFAEGAAVLRLKVDYAHANINMRDPIAYRIKFVPHVTTKDKWCIYPTYDYSHCIVDSLEDVTHSLCTLEFEVRRDPYYWILQALNIYRPHVWEFSRLNITKTLMSKRKINKLVKEKIVRGWDDPRLLTLAGLRRRGYTPEAIRKFCKDIGVSRHENQINMERLEKCCRDDLDKRSNRVFAVLEPLKVVLTNFAEDKVEMVQAQNHPMNKDFGARDLPFSKVIYIERKDFREVDDKDYFGLAPGKYVRLRFAYHIKCTGVKKNSKGEITEIEAEVDFEKTSKPKGTIHWVAQPKFGQEPETAEVRIYEDLFSIDVPDAAGDNWMQMMNKDSEKIICNAFVESSFATEAKRRDLFTKYQFERLGYFSIDPDTEKCGHLVFNRTVALNESYQKFAEKKETIFISKPKKEKK